MSNLYIVLDDDETWSGEAFIILEEDLTDDEKDLVDECDSKVFKNCRAPGISINRLVEALKSAGIWEDTVECLRQSPRWTPPKG